MTGSSSHLNDVKSLEMINKVHIESNLQLLLTPQATRHHNQTLVKIQNEIEEMKRSEKKSQRAINRHVDGEIVVKRYRISRKNLSGFASPLVKTRIPEDKTPPHHLNSPIMPITGTSVHIRAKSRHNMSHQIFAKEGV